MPDTYNNLGTTDQTTGGNSGTWGDIADLNFKILEEAIAGIATINFASDANKTITVTDGALSDNRKRVLLLTGTLSATRTLTIAPNDMTNVYWIVNNTTGGQSVTISQGGGSGSTITIPNGRKALVYVDGAGANANVVNLNAGIMLDRPVMASYMERVNALGSVTTATCDMSSYSVFTCTAGASLTVNLTNAPPSGYLGVALLFITNKTAPPLSSYTWQYGGSAMTIRSAGNVDPAPTNTASAVDVFAFYTLDGGTTFYAATAIANAS